MKKFVLLSVLMMLLLSTPLLAQLKVTLNVSSHPDPYLSNWAERKETVIVTVINSGTSSVSAKFDSKIYKDGSLIVNTKPEKMRMLDIPVGVSQYYGEDLVPLESANIINGADKTALRTGMLPAGSYQFCCALLDLQNRELTAPVCKNFTLQSYQVPMLLQPNDKAGLKKGERPMFRWTPLVPRPPTPVTYRLQVFEVLAGQTPMNAFRVNQPILDKSGITGTQYQWGADIELPRETMGYIWTVSARDEKDAPIGENGGYATPSTFKACCDDHTGDPPDDVTDESNSNTNNNSNGITGSRKKSAQVDDLNQENNQNINSVIKDENALPGVSLAKNSFLSSKNGTNPNNCPILLNPKANENISDENQLQFRWEFENELEAKQSNFLIIERRSEKNSQQSEVVLKLEVTGKLDYIPEKNVIQRILKESGEYDWSIQNNKGISCNTMSFRTGCDVKLIITNTTYNCINGTNINVCIEFEYEDRISGNPLTFADQNVNNPSGISAWSVPTSGVPVLLQSSNFVNVSTGTSNIPISNISQLSLPSGATYKICFDIASLSTPVIMVEIQGDNLLPRGVCRGYSSDEFDNPCGCTYCDQFEEYQNMEWEGEVQYNSQSNSIDVSTTVKMPSDLEVKSFKAEIINFTQKVENENQDCLTCNKDSQTYGNLISGTMETNAWESVNGLPPMLPNSGGNSHHTLVWYSPDAVNTILNDSKINLSVSVPPISKLDCCYDLINFCIRYTFISKDCQSCSIVKCYEIKRTQNQQGR